MNIEPTSDFGSTFLNLTKKYLSFVAECPHSIDVPNDQVLREHNFIPHGNVNFIAKGSVKQHQEDVKDLNHKRERQLKKRSTLANDLLGSSYTIRSRADRHHDLIEGTPKWGGECSYPKVLNMTTPNKSSSSQVGNSTLDDAAKEIMVVNTPLGLFQYQRLPYGIVSAPAIFQRHLEQLLSEIEGCGNYLDDKIISAPTVDQHRATNFMRFTGKWHKM